MKRITTFVGGPWGICITLLGAAVGSLHCQPSGGEPVVAAETPPAPSGSAAVPPVLDAGVSEEIRADGGFVAVDSGRDPAAITVCGGAKGDPNKVPALQWSIYRYPSKYAVVLGAEVYRSEPLSIKSTSAIAAGTLVPPSGGESQSLVGGGPFNTVAMSKRDFVGATMYETDVSASDSIALGWSDTIDAVYTLSVDLAPSGFKHVAVGGTAGHFSGGWWTLGNPSRVSSTPDTGYFVSRIKSARGAGWIFTIHFDVPCKLQGLVARVGENPLGIFARSSTSTRADISKFLVDNDARLGLTAVIFGAPNPALSSTLTGTQASAADLDGLETVMTAFSNAMKGYTRASALPDYTSVSQGTNPEWVIGEVIGRSVTQLPQ